MTEDATEGLQQEEAQASYLQPRHFDEDVFEQKEPGSGLTLAIALFVGMIAVMVGLWIWTRKTGFSLNRTSGTHHLDICETKALGNRQFLVVVKYGEQRMLLGVAPGMINHLCYLESDPATENDALNPPESNE